MTTLLQHAKAELRAAGMFDEDSDFNGEIGVQVTSLMETLNAYQHSGGSLELTLEVFDKIAHHMPLTPLTGEDSEWETPPSASPAIGIEVNRRCTQVFRDKDMAWDVRKGRTPITFPYTPPEF